MQRTTIWVVMPLRRAGGPLALAALLCAPTGVGPDSRQRAPVVESVDLFIPMAPQTVRIAGRMYIVYELHITNFLLVDAAITRIQVTREGSPDTSLADYRDGDVRSRIGRPGRRREQGNPEVVGPGMRAVAYLWIALPEGSAVPRTLGHRVELDILRETGSVRAEVESSSSSVSRESAVVLDPPLRGGPWVSIYDPELKGGHRTAIYTVGGRARIPGRFAIDWIRLPEGGALESDRVPRPADWNGYGSEVLAVADGIVASAMDDIPDNAATPDGAAVPITLENASGNFIALDLGHGRFAFYEHLKRGSFAVKAGDRVQSGQVIARLGHSGTSSIGPHLHFHVSDGNSPLAAEGLPFVFTRFEQLGAFSSIGALIGGERYLAEPGGPVNERRLERPGANSVIRFR